ncbi:MAG: response regulator [Bacteroidales bacterium]|nr:response regulator [Bacteroidales bacterium]
MESEKIKILTIDDNQDNLISLNALIKEAFPNAIVFNALNGEKGIEIAATEDPDVILLDIVMPNMDGFDVCQKLKADKKLSDIPIVFVTALKGDKESRIRALECGAEAFLAKPIDEVELKAQICAMLKIKIANVKKRDEKEILAVQVEKQIREINFAHTATLNLLEDLKNENEARKKSQIELRKSEELFKSFVLNSADLTALTDLNDYILFISPQSEKLLGFSCEGLIGQKIPVNIYLDDKETYLQKWNRLKTNAEEIYNFEYRILDIRGELHWVSHSAIQVKVEQNLIGIQSTIRDITENKLAEQLTIQAKEKAEESDRLKTAFLHNISHEIRTPINSIIGFSEFLNEPNLTPEKLKYFTDIITQSSYQLLSIISDIVSIATIEAGQEKVSEVEFNLNYTLRFLYEQFQLKNQKQNFCFILKHLLPDNEITILSDETKLVQILTNLIGNAIKFTRQGYVNFGYKLKDKELEFFVEDTGIGIPHEMHEEIFKRFRQVESTIARQYGGSGLGLSISKAYVELLGGRIWLISELNKGSTFYFTIPYKKVKKTPIVEKQPLKEMTDESDITKTILIAEDEDSNFMLLEEMLSGLNINIIRAINGIEAVNTCKLNNRIDLILMDIKMPIMDGYEATKQIKKFKPNLPIIAQTAYSTEVDKNMALSNGCNDFVSKPIKKILLISKIKEHLSRTLTY